MSEIAVLAHVAGGLFRDRDPDRSRLTRAMLGGTLALTPANRTSSSTRVAQNWPTGAVTYRVRVEPREIRSGSP
jgi:hypothetical protein